MNETEKLRMLIPHWVEHNDEHAEEYYRWAGKTAEAGADLLAAAEMLKRVNQALATALEKLGGAISQPHDH
jgi:delta-aminolevulinic acid dehydratase/porphobilinogen synthase